MLGRLSGGIIGGGGTKASPPLSVLRRRRRRRLAAALVALALATAAALLLTEREPAPPCCPPDESLLRQPRPGPIPEQLATAAQSVYLLELRDGDGNRLEIGTAWVLDRSHLVASAEAARLLASLGEDERLLARPPGAAEAELRIVSATIHPAAAILADRLPPATAGDDTAGSTSLAYDLAILALSPGQQAGTPLPLGNAADLRVGDGLGSVVWRRGPGGAAFEQREVSGRLRSLTGLFGMPPLGRPDLLLHDFPLGVAAAGAPVLDGEGRVVGVTGGVAFVGAGDARYPLAGTATPAEALAALAAGEEGLADELSALWPQGEALLAGEGTVESFLVAAALHRWGAEAATPPAFTEVREGVLGEPQAPFAHPVSLQSLTLAAGRYLLLVEGELLQGDPVAPAVQLYRAGQPFRALPASGGPRGVTSFALEAETDIAIALLGQQTGASWRFRLLAWPD